MTEMRLEHLVLFYVNTMRTLNTNLLKSQNCQKVKNISFL